MKHEIQWSLIPEKEFENFKLRVELVEQLIDETISSAEKRDLKQDYCRINKVTDRTIRRYVHAYRKKGQKGLVFYRLRKKSVRVKDEVLRKKIVDLVRELPERDVPQIMRLLSLDETYREKIQEISCRTLYRFLYENGMSKKERYAMMSEDSRRAYHKFEAPHSMALVQGDARDGIWIKNPEGKLIKTYLFLWLDDYSRKILFGKYYSNEKLPCMEDSFKYMLLRWGIPIKIYLDNGSVYISRQFANVVSDFSIKRVHHKPYQAHSKGKVEAANKTIKNQFQKEAALSGFRTLDELNTAFWAWCEVVYNTRVHSSTGEVPNDRFIKGLPENHRRVEDLTDFNAKFLWRDVRKIDKYGKIKLHSNQYPVTKLPHGKKVTVRFDPFDLREVHIYDMEDLYLETSGPNKMCNARIISIPEESQKTEKEISQDSVRYFTSLREAYQQNQKKSSGIFSKLEEKNNG